jgi:hypothetical protein
MEVHGAFVDGTTGVMHTRAGQHHQIRFTRVEPGHSFDLETSVLPLTQATFHCEVVPTEVGSTISQTVSMSGPLAWLFGLLAGERIAKSFEPLLDRLAAQAETAG